jgi:hypothetical protein
MSRPIGELEVRAALPFSHASEELREKCVEVARAKSPSAAFDLGALTARMAGLNQLETLGIAKATRWLSAIRRDYGMQKFEEVVRTLTTKTTPKL